MQDPLPYDADVPLTPGSADEQSRALLDQVRQRRAQRKGLQPAATATTSPPPANPTQVPPRSHPQLAPLPQKARPPLHRQSRSSPNRDKQSPHQPGLNNNNPTPPDITVDEVSGHQGPASASPHRSSAFFSRAHIATQQRPHSALAADSQHYSDAHLRDQEEDAAEAENERPFTLSRHSSLDSTYVNDLTRSGTVKLVLPPGPLVQGIDLDLHDKPHLLHKHGVQTVSTAAQSEQQAHLQPQSAAGESDSGHRKQRKGSKGSSSSSSRSADQHRNASDGSGSGSHSSQNHSSSHRSAADPIFSPALKAPSSSSSAGEDSDHPTPEMPAKGQSRPGSAAERDILDILRDMAEDRERKKEAVRSDSGTGRRTYVSQATDINGDPFATINTSLSPIEEMTERSSRSGVSTVSTFRDSMASRHGFLTSPERRGSQQSNLTYRTTSRGPPGYSSQQHQYRHPSQASQRPAHPLSNQFDHEPVHQHPAHSADPSGLGPDSSTPTRSRFLDEYPSPSSSSLSSKKSTSDLIKAFEDRAQQGQPPSPTPSPRKRAAPLPARRQRGDGSITPRAPSAQTQSSESLRPREFPSLQDWVSQVDSEAKKRKAERQHSQTSSTRQTATVAGSIRSAHQQPPSRTSSGKSQQPSIESVMTGQQAAGPSRGASNPFANQRLAPPMPQQGASTPYSPFSGSDMTVSSDHTVFSLNSQTDVLHHGELFYAPPSGLSSSGRFRWAPCRAVLIPNNLLLSYDDRPGQKPVEKRIKLSGCSIVESVRLPRTTSGAEQDFQQQAFKLEWANGKIEHFACYRATERVNWLASILDTINFSSCANSIADTVTEPEPRAEHFYARGPPVAPSTQAFDDAQSHQQDDMYRLFADVEAMSALSESEAQTVHPQKPSLNVSKASSTSRPLPTPSLRSNAPLPDLPQAQDHGMDPLGYAQSSRSSSDGDRGFYSPAASSSLATESLQRYALQDPGPSPTASILRTPLSPRSSMRRRVLAQQAQSRQNISPKKRGAWSDVDRRSVQSEAALLGPSSSRAVARDMRRLLTSLERQDSQKLAGSRQHLSRHLQDIDEQLNSIASKLKSHEDDLIDPDNKSNADPDQPMPNLADKVDYMIQLSQILRESQDKVSSAVEAKLRQQGISLEAPSSPEFTESDTKSLKVKALDRIEDLLGAVLERLESAAEEQRPAASYPTAPQSYHGRQAASYNQETLTSSASATPRGARSPTSTVPESELLAMRHRSTLQAQNTVAAQSWSQDSSPRSQRRVDEERERAREKLEQPSELFSTHPPQEHSHWSPDTHSGQNNSNGTAGAPQDRPPEPNSTNSTFSISPEERHHIPPTPAPSKDPGSATPRYYNESTQSASTFSSAPPGPDPATMELLQSILSSLQEQSQVSNANTGYQREVGEYLNRFDEYLRKEAANRREDWQHMTENLTQLERKVSMLSKQRKISASSNKSKKDGEGKVPLSRKGSALLRKASLGGASSKESLQEQEQTQTGEPPRKGVSPQGKRKRSISLPKFAGENLRIWGGPNPVGNPDTVWGPKPHIFNKKPGFGKKSAALKDVGEKADDLLAGSKFDTLEAALTSYGMAQAKPEGLRSPAGPRMPPQPKANDSQTTLVDPTRSKGSMDQPPRDIEEDSEPEPENSDDESPEPEKRSAESGILSAIKTFMSQLTDHQKREEERDKLAEARYQELLTKAAEPSPVDQEKQMNEKAENIERQRQDEKLQELISVLRTKSEQHDSLLREIFESVTNMPPPSVVNSPSQQDTSNLLAALADGVNVQVNQFKDNMSVEVKKALNDVSTLREQKKGLQNDIAELMSFKARNQNGAPDHAAHTRPQQQGHPNNNGGAPSGLKSRMAGTFAGPPAGGETFSPFGRPGNGRGPPPPPPPPPSDGGLGDGQAPPPEARGGPHGGPSQPTRFGPVSFGNFGPRAPARN